LDASTARRFEIAIDMIQEYFFNGLRAGETLPLHFYFYNLMNGSG
jgi:hypothetical protein